MVLNRNTAKLVGALAVPLLIAYAFWYSKQEAEREWSHWKTDQLNNPTTQQPVIKDYTMKEIDGENHLRWQLKAREGTIMPNGQDVNLSYVTVEYFDSATKALKMRLDAPAGTANATTKYVKLQGDGKQRVHAEGEGGKSKFVADTVELTKKNQFNATGGVIIEWPGVAKVSGNSAFGSTNMSAGPKDFKIVGNTHAEFQVR